MAADEAFRPALLVIDVQEDFCPPNGSLAVDGGRDIAPGINRLLDMPGFVLKVATGDWHPPDHASFASSHGPPDNAPFVDTVEMRNPANSSHTLRSTLWPDHCIQDTPGAALIPEIDSSKLHRRLNKGMDARAEMYSGFRDIFGNRSGASFDLADYLRESSVSHVYVVGLTGDCCVFHSALDASKEHFKTIVLEDLTRSISHADFDAAKAKLRDAGVVRALPEIDPAAELTPQQIIALSSGPEVIQVAKRTEGVA